MHEYVDIKNDYYESISINNIYIKETINYYIGLAENAIEFIKYNDIYTDRLFICNCNKNELYNPLNIVLDCKEREVGEIIKKEFFYNDLTIDEIRKIINNYDIKKVIARLLYPNYYFDIVDGQNYYWVVYGYFDGTNVFKYGQAYYKGLMKRLQYDDWGWLTMHEMSHVFDSYRWEFDAETLAQFKSYYVMEIL